MSRHLPRVSLLARVALCAAVFTVACQSGTRPSTMPAPAPPPSTSPRPTSVLGFDTRVFPGDAALSAWKYPASPYRWIGYYLAAPCHRDASFVGKYSSITAAGWGVAAIYVGQQDWANAPSTRPPAATGDTTATKAPGPIICSATLLTTDQGAVEAADAVAKLRADGFPDGSTIFLDIERVTRVSAALIDYYRAWMAGVLADGRYKPGVYVNKANAAALRDVEITVNGTRHAPAFWIASPGEISLTATASDVGLDYAQIWQGAFDVTQTFNGVSLRIDVNVMTNPGPP